MKETVNNLKRVYKYGRKYKKNLIMFTLMSITFVIINILMPIIGAKQIVYLSSSLYEELLYATLLILGIEAISFINHWILKRNTQEFFRGTTKDIQLDVVEEILKIKQSDIDKESSGVFIQRIGNDTDEMSKVFTRGMSYLTNILTDIGIFIAVFIINKVMFLFYLVGALILTILNLNKARMVKEKEKLYREQRERTSGLIGELIRGVRDIKMLNAKSSFTDEIENNIDALTKSQFDMRNADMNYSFIIKIITSIIKFFLIVILIYLLAKSYITVATAIVLYNYRTRVLTNLMNQVENLLTEITNFNLSSNRVFSILDNNEFKKETFGSKHINQIKGNFEFRNVHFSYGNILVLQDLSFKIRENETVAFVGKSGAGKTTIFSLLCKLYEIEKGKILLDGNDIEDLDEYSIRNNITIISQNPYIFNMSIKDNLRLVKDNLTDEEMIESCKMACLTDFIEDLPDKYDTIVGEGGVTLSGGAKATSCNSKGLCSKY